MARKKTRERNRGLTAKPDLSRAGGAVASVVTVSSNGDTAHGTHKSAGRRGMPVERTWLEAWIVQISRWLGSLHMAVILLSLFVVALAIGTIAESWYSAKIAQELVYQTWWFQFLLGFLGVNIFFAAAKKWPWKKHQTGFLITHVGLLTLIAGGIMNSMAGTDAMMSLIDSSHEHYQEKYGLPQSGNAVILTDERTISVKRIRGDKEIEQKTFDFEPGSLLWRPDEHIQPRTELLLSTLNWLAHPLPRSWQRGLGEGAVLEVLAFYPQARREPFAPAATHEKGFPAVKFQLVSPRFGTAPPEWISMNPETKDNSDAVFRRGPAVVELLPQMPRARRDEFLHPSPELVLRKKQRYDGDEVRGVLELAHTDDGKLYYRSFNSRVGGFNFESSGEVTPGKNQDIWSGMNWKFRVAAHLPAAVAKRHYFIEDARPGLQRPDLTSVLRCRLSSGKAEEEFMLGLERPEYVAVGGQYFSVKYTTKTKPLGFEVKLLRAEQRVDPGTNRAATFTSWVQVNDPSKDIYGKEHVITMNEPMEYGGYTFFQSNYDLLGIDDRLKGVSHSGFTVARDPGLWLKYFGSSMLALGIATMFYMRAYFFRPRGRRAAEGL